MAATPAEAIARGVDYLLGMRDAGGGWRRSRYGALRGGAALTAFTLRVLSRLSAPENTETQEKAGPTARRDSASRSGRRGIPTRGPTPCSANRSPTPSTFYVLDWKSEAPSPARTEHSIYRCTRPLWRCWPNRRPDRSGPPSSVSGCATTCSRHRCRFDAASPRRTRILAVGIWAVSRHRAESRPERISR